MPEPRHEQAVEAVAKAIDEANYSQPDDMPYTAAMYSLARAALRAAMDIAADALEAERHAEHARLLGDAPLSTASPAINNWIGCWHAAAKLVRQIGGDQS